MPARISTSAWPTVEATPALASGVWTGLAGAPGGPRQHPATPSTHLSKFYYDCLTHSEAALRMVIDTAGIDRVIFGTDWPADMAIDWPVSWILSLQSLTQEEKEAILYKTWRNS